eukprot:TRINITY_DN11070_c0_g2_i2.p1 TRINITY_DN11070_c0_g2~~TRINITY_DN11070_c0_g2_i2.p1  ORF type:complete len:657 (+),score=76.79 TRINITY_DN11070_c0_g2_i2:955-2925(+)
MSENLPLLASSDPKHESQPRRKASVLRRASKGVSTFFGLEDDAFPLATERFPRTSNSKPKDQPDGYRDPYYHGSMSAEQASERLKLQSNNHDDGLYLIRQDESGQYILCLLSNDTVYQFLIDSGHYVPGKYSIEEGPAFSRLSSLVLFYQQEAEGLPCKLTKACPKSNMLNVTDLLREEDASSRRSSIASTGTMESYLLEHDQPLARSHSQRSADSVAAALRQPSNRIVRPYRLYRKEEGAADKANADKLYELVGKPQFKPHFIQLVTMAQLLIMCYVCLRGGIEPLHFQPVMEVKTITPNFDPNFQTQVTVEAAGNPFAGPSSRFLVGMGAKFAPCMRQDIAVKTELARQAVIEQRDYGCCVEAFGNNTPTFRACGMTIQADCPHSWSRQRCSSDCDDVRLRPCCLQLNGTCAITTKSYCQAYHGVWQTNALLCEDVACLEESCGRLSDPNHPDQGWRFISAMFLHTGVIHFVINIAIQLNMGQPLEAKTGWLRTALIYFISGLGGNLVSGVFVPRSPQVGASGAVYGLIGAAVVDLFHSWQALKRPWSKAGGFLIQVALLLLLGTTPWLDQFAHVGGFVFGLLSGIVFLPYVTFGAWDRFRKRLLLLICIPVMLILLVVLLVIFYRVQNSNFCPGCEIIQCVEYTDGFCDNLAF